jgi:hypothetical protein
MSKIIRVDEDLLRAAAEEIQERVNVLRGLNLPNEQVVSEVLRKSEKTLLSLIGLLIRADHEKRERNS